MNIKPNTRNESFYSNLVYWIVWFGIQTLAILDIQISAIFGIQTLAIFGVQILAIFGIQTLAIFGIQILVI
jgi:hypothetical protein